MLILAGVSFVIWLGLIFFRGRFWSRGPILYPLSEEQRKKRDFWPAVHIIVPARNEAETIEKVILSLLNQDYIGFFDITLVNDGSIDGTGKLIRSLRETLPERQRLKLQVVDAARRPDGWSGKLWALYQGISKIDHQKSEKDSFFFFTDADIDHEPTHLTSLVNKALKDDLNQVSEMVKLRCDSLFEKALIPAFVFFFCMLYPFSKVNKPSSSIAAGAGGTVLIRKKALKQIGGIAALKNALIDDVTLATLVKKKCGRIYLGHSSQAVSLRPYNSVEAIWNMITRSAYVQLHYSIAWLIATIILMMLIWFSPFLQVVLARGYAQQLAFVTYAMSILSFVPTLSRFQVSYLWILALPFIAFFYLMATVGSAINFYRGKGMVWKGRAYTNDSGKAYEKDTNIDTNITLSHLVSFHSINKNTKQKDHL